MQLAALSLLAFVVAAGALFSMHLEQPSQRAGAPRRRRQSGHAERPDQDASAHP
jgi:hypothetical protein